VKFVLKGGDFDFQLLLNFLSEIDHFWTFTRESKVKGRPRIAVFAITQRL
jgi:hypothetical protein